MTTHPQRVSIAGQRWFNVQLPPNTVYVGRAYGGVKGHPLRNPHAVGKPCKARCHCKDTECQACGPCKAAERTHALDEALDLYRGHLIEHPDLIAVAAVLLEDGWSMACWCPISQPCHVDVLIDMAELVANDLWEAA